MIVNFVFFNGVCVVIVGWLKILVGEVGWYGVMVNMILFGCIDMDCVCEFDGIKVEKMGSSFVVV